MKNCIKKLEDFNEFLLVFKVFENFPFFEKWTVDEIRREFDVNQSNGYIFGYYEDGLCVGFISVRNQSPNEHPVHYGHENKVLYISDLAVLPQHRGQGIATQLLKHALEVAVSENYAYAYLRINHNNPMGLEIAKNAGFRKEHDLCQVVSRPHTNERLGSNEEFRIFMTKKL